MKRGRPYTRRGQLIEHWMEIAAQAALVLGVLTVYLVTGREACEMLAACQVIDTETAAIRRLLIETSNAA